MTAKLPPLISVPPFLRCEPVSSVLSVSVSVLSVSVLSVSVSVLSVSVLSVLSVSVLSVVSVRAAPQLTADLPLEGTYWRAVELIGARVQASGAAEAHLVFHPGGRISGSDGCNPIMGIYTVTGDRLTIGRIAGTQLACPGGAAPGFRTALERVAAWRIAGSRLEFYGVDDKPLAAFEGRAPGARAAAPAAD